MGGTKRRVTIVRTARGEESPTAFERSVFLAAEKGADWPGEAVKLLEAEGFDDGVVFMGGGDPETDTPALEHSDVIVCCKLTSPPMPHFFVCLRMAFERPFFQPCQDQFECRCLHRIPCPQIDGPADVGHVCRGGVGFSAFRLPGPRDCAVGPNWAADMWARGGQLGSTINSWASSGTFAARAHVQRIQPCQGRGVSDRGGAASAPHHLSDRVVVALVRKPQGSRQQAGWRKSQTLSY
jgi:hypothetical protein